jgi:hypothetical protein
VAEITIVLLLGFAHDLCRFALALLFVLALFVLGLAG